MTDLRTAAQQALEACEQRLPLVGQAKIIDELNALRAALAEPGDFDHGIGADRFKVVRGAFWWHVLIGDGTKKYGKFHTQAGAKEMATLLLREFKNGAFVQHRAALADGDKLSPGDPVQEPVAWMTHGNDSLPLFHGTRVGALAWGAEPLPLYAAPPQRKPLTEEEIQAAWDSVDMRHPRGNETRIAFARSIEQAHGIGE